MYNYICFLLIMGFLSLNAFAQGKKAVDSHTLTTAKEDHKGIDFNYDWEEVKKMAKEQNKYIFADVYASWCGPCKKLIRETFPNERVGDFYNENFINFKVDMNKPENKSMNSIFRVRAFPTLIYYNPDGEEVYRYMGFRPAESFIREGRRALFDEEVLAQYEEDYKIKKNKKSSKFLAEYINYMNNGGVIKSDVVETYLKLQSKKDLTSATNTDLIFDATLDVNSPFFKVLQENKAHFEKEKGVFETNMKIRNMAIMNVQAAIEDKDDAKFEQSIAIIEGLTLDNKEMLNFQLKLDYYLRMENWNAYKNTANDYLADNELENHSLLNNIAWNFYEQIDDKEDLAKAEGYARAAIKIKSQYNNHDTLAALLFKQGKTEEGKERADKAINIAKATKKNFKATLDLLKKYDQD